MRDGRLEHHVDTLSCLTASASVTMSGNTCSCTAVEHFTDTYNAVNAPVGDR